MWPFPSRDQRFRKLANKALRSIKQGRRLIVVGSQSFNDPTTFDVCFEIGRHLALVDDLVLITGGVSGVPEATARSFCEERLLQGHASNTYQLLPKGCGSRDFGETIFAGRNMLERREVLGRLSNLYICLEGGPGTEHEISVARVMGASVIPVGRCGGLASNLWSSMACPKWISRECWLSLGDKQRPMGHVGPAIKKIVRAYYQRKTQN